MTPYRSQRLGPDHDLDAFESGVEVLDEWLRRFARHADAANTGRTFVWAEPGSPRVVAYFTLAAHLIRRADVPARIGRGSPDAIPAVLLARLALDRPLHGHGLGGELLFDALSLAVEASDRAAARLIVVDAIDDHAAAFYQHWGFRPCAGTRRLVRKTSEINAALRKGN